MSLIKNLKTDHYLISLIQKGAAGNAHNLARKFEVNHRTVLRWINDMKKDGFPIKYCNLRCSYIFTKKVTVDITIKIDDSELLNIKGGMGYNAPSEINKWRWSWIDKA